MKSSALQQHLAIGSDNRGVIAQDPLPWLNLARIVRNAGLIDSLEE
jgi:hypothetical protein